MRTPANRGRGGRGLVGLPECLALGLALLCAALLSAGVASPARAAGLVSPWAPVQWPGAAAWAAHDVYAFGTADIAVAGDGHVAVTRDGGKTWRDRVPAGHEGTAFTAVAFNSSGRGVVASGGLLLVSPDWGVTWTTPVYAGPAPGAAINDLAMLGSLGVAVGDAGTILTSADSGATWQPDASPTTSDLTSVAIAGDGTEVAGSKSGEILVCTTAWAVAATAAGPVTAVTASDRAIWGDGQPDLFAATGHDVLGSDDALAFASLPGLPDLTSPGWPVIAWVGVPERSLLVAGAAQAGFFGTSRSWAAGPTGLDSLTQAAAPGGQSVAYLLGADGRLVRTLSAGRDPAVLTLAQHRIVTGGKTRLTATVRVAADGAAILRTRIPGHSWSNLRRLSWTTSDWSRSVNFDLSPALSHDYQLLFEYAGTTTPLAAVAHVVVEPRVITARSHYDLRVGAVFRFSGSVAPTLPGERVGLFTDRGGSWRPVSLQHSVALQGGRSWRSRLFGTPKAETYHLRAYLPATRAHAEAWSRVVTVTIR